MLKGKITSIKCIDNEDWFQDTDEITMTVVHARRSVMSFSTDIKKGKTVSVNREFRFTGSASLELHERDPHRRHLLGRSSLRGVGSKTITISGRGYKYQIKVVISDISSGPGGRRPFLPSRDGFRFRNSFSAREVTEELTLGALPAPLRALFPNLGTGDWGPAGLCGGMSAAAADYYIANRRRPTTTATPARGSQLFSYLVRRQMDTFNPSVTGAIRFFHWMLRDQLSNRVDTLKEVRKIAAQLDRNGFCTVGLLRVLGLKAPTENHQVLAYNYQGSPEGTMRINIYEPNYPKHNYLVIESVKQKVDVTIGDLLNARRVQQEYDFVTGNSEIDKLLDKFEDLLEWASRRVQRILRIKVHSVYVANVKLREMRTPPDPKDSLTADDAKTYGLFAMNSRAKRPPR